MSELPSGAVTLLFTDIEGSTQLLRRLGEAYGRVLAGHHRLLRQAFAAHDGHEVDNQGDSFFVAFARPLDAVLAAAQAQQALFAHPWPDGAAVRVRMGLHTGEPLLNEDQDHYLGLDVHQAARIEAAAHGGQVLLSRATTELVQNRLPEGLELRSLGEHRLKDFERPQPLYQLLVDGLPSSFPSLRSAVPESEPEEPESRQGSIPALVGREAEVGLLRERLQMARTGRGSLVLLAGEPGIGKTRLAEEMASEARRGSFTVLWGRCWEGEGAPPFWPWRELLRAYSEQQSPLSLRTELGSGAAVLSLMLPELRERLPDLPEPAPLDSEAARFRLFDAVNQALINITQARPLLLLLDDLHWADKASLLLLQFLAQRLGTARLLLLGTYRDTDLDRRHPLAEVLPALRRGQGVERLALHGLEPGGSAHAAGAAAGAGEQRPWPCAGRGVAARDGGQSLLYGGGRAAPAGERQAVSAGRTLDERRGWNRGVGNPRGRAGGDRPAALAAPGGDEPAADPGIGRWAGVRVIAVGATERAERGRAGRSTGRGRGGASGGSGWQGREVSLRPCAGAGDSLQRVAFASKSPPPPAGGRGAGGAGRP